MRDSGENVVRNHLKLSPMVAGCLLLMIEFSKSECMEKERHLSPSEVLSAPCTNKARAGGLKNSGLALPEESIASER